MLFSLQWKKILYSFLYRKCINHIHILNFLLLHYLSHMWTPFGMTCFSLYSLYLYLVYIPHMRESIGSLAFWTWLTSHKIMFSSFIHLPANNEISFFFMAD
jgi:hypothetical protein